MADFISTERLSVLVGLIYDCAIDPGRWPIAMEAIRRELDCHNATLDLMLLPSGEALTSIICNVPAHFAALIPGAGPDVLDSWGGEKIARSLPINRPAVLTRVNPGFDVETSTNGYCVAFARPQGIIDVLAVALARDARAIGTISFGRHRSAGPLGEREISIAELLLPHLQRAATINRLLEGAMLAQTSFAATIDALSAAVVLVDAKQRIVHANPAARILLERGTLIRAHDGRLRSVTAGTSSVLDAAVGEASRGESAIGRRGLGIPVLGPDGSYGAIHVLPLRREPRGSERGPVAAVFAAQMDSPLVAPTEVVAALFSLTPAEARVFELIAGGCTLANAAATLEVEQSTIKTHLLRVYGKVGVKRQSGLMKIAASLAPPILADFMMK